MKRLNITIPEDLSKQLEPIRNKSRFISEVLKEKFEIEKKRELDKLLVEGYQFTKKEDKKINKEWEEITLEGWL